jgi:excisionase family DNA binding protein
MVRPNGAKTTTPIPMTEATPTTEETARHVTAWLGFRVSPEMIRSWTRWREERLPMVKVGQERKILLADLRTYCEARAHVCGFSLKPMAVALPAPTPRDEPGAVEALPLVPQRTTHRTLVLKSKHTPVAPPPLDRLLTPREVAQILGLSEAAVTKRITRGQIPAVRLGARGYRVKQSVLTAYIEALPEV